MIKWIKQLLFKPKFIPSNNLKEAYWYMQPSLVRTDIGVYTPLSLGWIYSGLYDMDRHSIGRGWYRHNLVVL
jgi:hypothetical protein